MTNLQGETTVHTSSFYIYTQLTTERLTVRSTPNRTKYSCFSTRTEKVPTQTPLLFRLRMHATSARRPFFSDSTAFPCGGSVGRRAFKPLHRCCLLWQTELSFFPSLSCHESQELMASSLTASNSANIMRDRLRTI
jgi:hypothetical protein